MKQPQQRGRRTRRKLALARKNEKTKALVEGRYIDGLTKIRSAPKIDLEPGTGDKKAKKKKNFGGKGGSGNKNKGVKNAKRATALT